MPVDNKGLELEQTKVFSWLNKLEPHLMTIPTSNKKHAGSVACSKEKQAIILPGSNRHYSLVSSHC